MLYSKLRFFVIFHFSFTYALSITLYLEPVDNTEEAFALTQEKKFTVILSGSRFGGEFPWEMRWNTVKKTSPRCSYIFLRWMRWIAVNYLYSPGSRHSYKKRHFRTRVWTSYLYDIFCEFNKPCKTKAVNFLKKFREFEVNLSKKSGEMRWNVFFSPHSPQSAHFLQKFTVFTAFLTKIHAKTSTRVG